MNELEFLKQRAKIEAFLIKNGWTQDEDYYEYQYRSFSHPDTVSIDMPPSREDQVIFIDDQGDFAHMECNFYTVVGFIYVNKFVSPLKI